MFSNPIFFTTLYLLSSVINESEYNYEDYEEDEDDYLYHDDSRYGH